MNPDHHLVNLARKMLRDLPTDSAEARERLVSWMLPLVRTAIRSGIGQPSLVHWVRRETGQDVSPTGPNGLRAWPPADPMEAAAPLARTLCDRLLARINPLPQRSTVGESAVRTRIRTAV